jgi:hypothetical protein
MLNVSGENLLSKKKKNNASWGCLLLFLAPFFAAGIFLVGLALKNTLEHGWNSEQSWGPLIGGAMFLAVSSAFLLVGKLGHKEERKRERQIEQYPHEPWKWNSEWESGWISTKSHNQVVVLWIFAIVFTGFGVPIIVKIFDDAEKEPLLFVFLLLSAARRHHVFAGHQENT